ncbi:pyruvoyl-dependent arginine decarboxylase subunit alpha [Haladaptatus sp. R4]|uniref:pyruvoyl-dependent arginine decarboxylase n=1 Tax=Haladaptatus sp. R4 TaxID=1679489 RepID=UPI0007B4D8FD|nr:pyruvoyl-dependent arginine decarboxylase [Haladaptatus sp. R4]KZN25397.1 pyruvoyl-dependent arginine decarboxylase subunit alpha [Haladaptatus sp. R4]
MSTIRVVWGTASGPTKMSSYDAALAEANVHNYNLVSVSSVIPADTPVEAVGTAPDLGPAGNRLTVVEARATRPGPGHVSAGLGWSESDGAGLFYEASGDTDATEIEERVRAGLEAGRALRDWEFSNETTKVVTADAESGTYVTAVVLAVYGRSEPIC